MKIAVVGSRSLDNYQLVKSILEQYTFTQIISGGAKGVDTLAIEYAADEHLPLKKFPADWSRGKQAGFIRNGEMAKYANEECQKCKKSHGQLIAVWDGQSTGTESMIKIARELGLAVHVLQVGKS